MGAFTAIPPVPPGLLGSSGISGPGFSSYLAGERDGQRPRQEGIPPIEELRSSSRGVTSLHAPNLTTYIEHYREFYFL